MPTVSGFESPVELAEHYKKHVIKRKEFGIISKAEYDAMAKAFLSAPLSADFEECIRSREGDLIRYNKATNEFGVLRSDGVIRTYFKPNPSRHGLPTNLDYFYSECV